MKFSEIDAAIAAKYMRVELEGEAQQLTDLALKGAKQYCISYTGLSAEELDKYDDVPLAVLALCSELFDLRQFTVSEAININPTTEQILNSYSVNLL